MVTHELSHARSRGPLKLVLGQVAVRSLFWVPVLRDLVDRYLLLTELAADRAAVAATSRAALAGALSQVLETPKLAGSIGFADHAAARIDRLFDPFAKLPRLLTPDGVAVTVLSLGTAAGLVCSSPRLTSTEHAAAPYDGQPARAPSAGAPHRIRRDCGGRVGRDRRRALARPPAVLAQGLTST